MATIGEAISAALRSRARELTDAGAAPAREVAARIAMSARDRSLMAVLVVGALASAAPWLDGDDSVTPEPDPSPSADALQTVTVPLDADAWDGSLYLPRLECGAAIPDANVSERGFYLETTVIREDGSQGATGGDSPAGTPTIRVSMTYLGEQIQDALVGEFTAYVVSDGKVVAVLESVLGSTIEPGTAISSGERFDGPTLTPGRLDSSYVAPCDWNQRSTEAMLKAGTYEIVVTQRVRQTPQTLALLDLQDTRYAVVGSDWGLWQPGSIDCREAVELGIEVSAPVIPVQCDPIGAKAAGIEISGDQVSLPYEARSGPMDLDLTLVSEPIQWVVAEDIGWDDTPWTFSDAPDPSDFTCDATLAWWLPEGIGGATPATNLQALAAQGGAAVKFDTKAVSRLQRATVELGSPGRAWLIREVAGGQQLVATATASFTPSVVPIDRAEDYAKTAIHLTDVVACPGQEQAEGTLDSRLLLVIASEIAIDDGKGTRDTTDYVLIGLGEER